MSASDLAAPGATGTTRPGGLGWWCRGHSARPGPTRINPGASVNAKNLLLTAGIALVVVVAYDKAKAGVPGLKIGV